MRFQEGHMAKRSYADIALDMYESVRQSNNKQKRLKSSTFWDAFRVGRRTDPVVERIGYILTEQKLKFSVKSGNVFGKEKYDDWIELSIWPPIQPEDPPVTDFPSLDWFQDMQTREFGSEREVEYNFVVPMLEKLGYDSSDNAIGYPVKMFEGVHRATKEADFVLFNGRSREKDDALLVVEAKKEGKGITVDNIGQAKSYARELLPACYIITNGQQIMVFQFNGMLYQDERVMDFDRSILKEMWTDLYKYASKPSTITRKIWMRDHFPKSASDLTSESNR
jgi:hypothetical protein